MKYVDEFRDPAAASRLLQQIRATATRPWTVMEVCGGQTHGLLRHGIPQELAGVVELIHGPGCPVCVTSEHAIDTAILLARRPGTVVASFGDMLRVPGTRESLLTARSRGARVLTVSSPLDAVRLAAGDPDRDYVFFAVGFETTAPASALAARQAQHMQLNNFFLLAAHVRVQPAMELLMRAEDCRVQAFLAAGHVCAVTGFASYAGLVRNNRVPVAVTGFEPTDLLSGILECVRQLEDGRAELRNCYQRTVSENGNPHARQLIDSVYEAVDNEWRGLGTVPLGGLRLRTAFDSLNAWHRFDVREAAAPELQPRDTRCRAAEVLSGQLRPCDCPEFGNACTPDVPLGAPMVSAEGACAAWSRYVGRQQPSGMPVIGEN